MFYVGIVLGAVIGFCFTAFLEIKQISYIEYNKILDEHKKEILKRKRKK